MAAIAVSRQYQRSDPSATARTAGRWLLSFYASTPAYRPVLEVEGWEDLQPELNGLSKSGRWDEMPALIDDAMRQARADGVIHARATANWAAVPS